MELFDLERSHLLWDRVSTRCNATRVRALIEDAYMRIAYPHEPLVVGIGASLARGSLIICIAVIIWVDYSEREEIVRHVFAGEASFPLRVR